MRKIASRLAVATAAASMVLTPIAAQANTRAGDNATIYSSSAVSQPGTARNASGEDLDGAFFNERLLFALIALLATAGVIIIIDDEDDQSPGT